MRSRGAGRRSQGAGKRSQGAGLQNEEMKDSKQEQGAAPVLKVLKMKHVY